MKLTAFSKIAKESVYLRIYIYYWECFKVQLSVAVSVYILSSKGTNQLQVPYIRTLGNIQGNFFTEDAILKCIAIFFWKFEEVLGQLKKVALENYVLAYHTANKDHTKIL